MQHLRVNEVWDPELGVHYWGVMVEDDQLTNCWVPESRWQTRHAAYEAYLLHLRQRASVGIA